MTNEEYGKERYSAYIEKVKKFSKEMTYKKRLIISGRYIEEYIYEKRVILGKKRIKKRKKKTRDDKQIKMDDGALRRSRMNIMRLVNCNLDFKTFVTLTFDENKFENKRDITEFEKCNYLFMKFIQRLKYELLNIKYLAVPEFQGDYYYATGAKKEFGGAVHYHLILNIKIDSKRLEKIWKHGFVKINKIKSINNVGLYISKYLSKESFNEKYFGKKKFFYSRNLDRIQEFRGDDCRFVEKNYLPMHDKVYEKTFENEYRGKVKFTLYKLDTGNNQ